MNTSDTTERRGVISSQLERQASESRADGNADRCTARPALALQASLAIRQDRDAMRLCESRLATSTPAC